MLTVILRILRFQLQTLFVVGPHGNTLFDFQSVFLLTTSSQRFPTMKGLLQSVVSSWQGGAPGANQGPKGESMDSPKYYIYISFDGRLNTESKLKVLKRGIHTRDNKIMFPDNSSTNRSSFQFLLTVVFIVIFQLKCYLTVSTSMLFIVSYRLCFMYRSLETGLPRSLKSWKVLELEKKNTESWKILEFGSWAFKILEWKNFSFLYLKK